MHGREQPGPALDPVRHADTAMTRANRTRDYPLNREDARWSRYTTVDPKSITMIALVAVTIVGCGSGGQTSTPQKTVVSGAHSATVSATTLKRLIREINRSCPNGCEVDAKRLNDAIEELRRQRCSKVSGCFVGGPKLSDPCPLGAIRLLSGKSSGCISTTEQPGFAAPCTVGEVREKLNGDNYACVQPEIHQ